MKKTAWMVGVVTLLLAMVPVQAEDAFIIPLKPDPPIAVDGQLDDWVEVPGKMVLRDPAHASYKPEAWDGPEDLSGTVRMAWRREGLFLAVEVTDDVHSQPNRG
ncbi:MAG: hypothetical protein R6V19_05215, partial [Armatimonadota bacterium]